jgi:hypothetical protein
MFKKTIENTSPKRQRVNESQSVHSLALRACKGAEHGAVQPGNDSTKVVGLDPQPPQTQFPGKKRPLIHQKQGIALKSHLCQDTDDFVDQHGC